MGSATRIRGFFLCDRCGRRYTRDKLRREWTGLLVDPGCLDPKPAQDFPRNRDLSDPTPYRDVRRPFRPYLWDEWDQQWQHASIPWDQDISL